MRKLTFISLCLAILALGQIVAQNNISLHAGLANPLKDFYAFDPADYKAAGAAPGITVGYLFTHQLSEKGIGLFLGTDLMANWLRKPAQDFLVENFPGGYDVKNFKFQKYFNIPVSAGFSYTYNADEKISLFANAGMVFNSLIISNYEVKTYIEEFESAYSLGYKLGGGIIINKAFTLSANYFASGEHYVKSKMKMGQTETEGKYLLKTNVMTLTLGRYF